MQDELENIRWKLSKIYTDLNQTVAMVFELQKQLEKLEPRLLTTDAPEMTVGDSDSVSQNSTDEAGVDCGHNYGWVDGHDIVHCFVCPNTFPRPEPTGKPDDFAPSPTPSFR